MSNSEELLPDIDAILEALPQARIGVVGDFCLDFYQFVDMSASEVSVETGLETLPVRDVRYSLGGAGNVVNNLRAMGARGVSCYGIVGDDPHGHLLVSLLSDAGAKTEGVFVQADGWLTQTYTKVMVDERENPRIDWGNFNVLSAELESRLVRAIEEALFELDLLIVNQQLAHGIQTPGLRRELARFASTPGAPVCITDSRDYSDEFEGSLRKLNEDEAARLCGRESAPGFVRSLEEARELASLLCERWGTSVLLTRGERGCLVRDSDGLFEVPGITAEGQIDTVGAGDSMLAGAAAGLATGRSLRRAAELGNLVAGVTVRKLHQTGTASPEEVRELAREASYRYRPELALAPELARYSPGTRIEVVTRTPGPRRFTHAIFDNDGTLSTLRQGWEEVMEPMMIRAILGSKAAGADDATSRLVAERVRGYIDRTTGVQTLIQMHGLRDLVLEMGFVPGEEVLSPEGYKEIYNRELMQRVEERRCILEAGELQPEDFLIKGSVQIVRALVELGIQVFLASGTDHADALAEAEALGYSGLFAGAIYGSVGDVHNDPKKMVIERILGDIGEGGRILTFGDGPVEMRETKKRGGYAVGVASNEVRRFGLNPVKRKRLIEAGADLIIPDFTQTERLVTFLFGD